MFESNLITDSIGITVGVAVEEGIGVAVEEGIGVATGSLGDGRYLFGSSNGFVAELKLEGSDGFIPVASGRSPMSFNAIWVADFSVGSIGICLRFWKSADSPELTIDLDKSLVLHAKIAAKFNINTKTNNLILK